MILQDKPLEGQDLVAVLMYMSQDQQDKVDAMEKAKAKAAKRRAKAKAKAAKRKAKAKAKAAKRKAKAKAKAERKAQRKAKRKAKRAAKEEKRKADEEAEREEQILEVTSPAKIPVDNEKLVLRVS